MICVLQSTKQTTLFESSDKDESKPGYINDQVID